MNVAEILSPYDHAPVECDGFTRIAHTKLVEHGIEHTVMFGWVAMGERRVTHLWVELPSGETVDYRARMWLGEEAPHGVFDPTDYPEVEYLGEEMEMEVPSPFLFETLITPVDWTALLG